MINLNKLSNEIESQTSKINFAYKYLKDYIKYNLLDYIDYKQYLKIEVLND